MKSSNKEQLEIVWLDPKVLLPYENNAKLHPPEQIAKIKNQIQIFGFDQPIVILPNKEIVKGHGRQLASIELNLKAVPCIIRKMTPEQATAARLGDNFSAESAWDYTKIKIDLDVLKAHNVDLQWTAMTQQQIEHATAEWYSNIELVDKTKENTDGIFKIIKVICAQDKAKKVREVIEKAIANARVKGVTVE